MYNDTIGAGICSGPFRSLLGFLSYAFRNFLEGTNQDDDVSAMSHATLGRIMGSLHMGDLMVGKEELLRSLRFAGDGEDLLRELMGSCLAYVIRDRLNPASGIDILTSKNAIFAPHPAMERGFAFEIESGCAGLMFDFGLLLMVSVLYGVQAICSTRKEEPRPG
jgi:hypothetical protein